MTKSQRYRQSFISSNPVPNNSNQNLVPVISSEGEHTNRPTDEMENREIENDNEM